MSTPSDTYYIPFLHTMHPNSSVSLDFMPQLYKKPLKVRLLYAHCPVSSSGKTAHLVVNTQGKEHTLLIARRGQRNKLNLPITGSSRVSILNKGDADIVLTGVQKMALQKGLQDKLENLGMVSNPSMAISQAKDVPQPKKRSR